jgi:20S proteasome alpha/beta subunit
MERMTIAAGFQCSDGVLLASDTLYSGENKRYGRKIWELQKGGPVVAAMAGAGTAVVMRRVRDELRQRLTKPASSRREIIDCVDGVLYQIQRKHTPKADEFPLSLLVAIRDEQGCALYESGGAAVLAQTDRHGTCIGWGYSLGVYFMDSLYRVRMPLRWASVVAAHLVKHCKAYVDSCGGDTHLLELHADGLITFHENQQEMASLEAHLGELDDALRVVLPGGSPFEASDFTLVHRMQELVKAIESVRRVQAAIAGATIESRLTIQGHPSTVRIDPVPKKEGQ